MKNINIDWDKVTEEDHKTILRLLCYKAGDAFRFPVVPKGECFTTDEIEFRKNYIGEDKAITKNGKRVK